MDTAKGIISHVQADLADSGDSLHLPRLLSGLQPRLRTHHLFLRDFLANKQVNFNNRQDAQLAALLRATGATLRAIADQFNHSGYRTRRGNSFHPWENSDSYPSRINKFNGAIDLI